MMSLTYEYLYKKLMMAERYGIIAPLGFGLKGQTQTQTQTQTQALCMCVLAPPLFLCLFQIFSSAKRHTLFLSFPVVFLMPIIILSLSSTCI